MAKEKSEMNKSSNAVKTCFVKAGYAISIAEVWIVGVLSVLLEICFAFCTVVGIVGGIILFIRHQAIQGWLYLGIGVFTAGLIFPWFIVVKKIIKTAVQITKMQRAKLTSGKKEEVK